MSKQTGELVDEQMIWGEQDECVYEYIGEGGKYMQMDEQMCGYFSGQLGR